MTQGIAPEQSEESNSSLGYLSGYKPTSISAQVDVLRKLFSWIGFPDQELFERIENGETVPPDGAEGFFAIPHWSKVSGTYSKAARKVISLLEKAYGTRFLTCIEGRLGSEYLRETEHKVIMMNKLLAKQKAGILIVPAQFGIRHRGRSVFGARASMNGTEFGLGVYEIGIMLLTQLELLQKWDDLEGVDCAGDEYSLRADGIFEYNLTFMFRFNWCKFRALPFYGADYNYGSASGFLVQ